MKVKTEKLELTFKCTNYGGIHQIFGGVRPISNMLV